MSEMEAVNSFNAELQSLYDVKPPISKGKMTAITRAALKAVKLYKHAVQSVEKFIQKCKPEYKIPGLYVIDSIIRQSRHQFGPEKDVFATRFARNIQTTFVHLYKCPDEDKAKVIRVLNLWQKNRIFSPEVIQPLFDLADPNNPIWETVQQTMMEPNYSMGGSGNNTSSNGNALQSSNNLGNSTSLGSSKINDSGGFLPPIHFKKELLDYDYDEEEDNEGAGHPPLPPPNSFQSNQGQGVHEINHNPLAGFDALGSILTNPEVLRQLQTLQEQMAAAAQHQQQQQQQMGFLNPEQERQRKLAELNKQEAAFDQRLAQTVARLPFAVDCDLPFPDSVGGDGKRSPRKDNTSSSSGYMQSSGSVDQNSNQLSNHQNQPGVLLPPPFFQQLSGEHNQQQGGVPLHHEQNQQQHSNVSNVMGVQPPNNPFGIPLTFPIQGVPPAFPPDNMPLSQNMGLFNSQMVLDGMNRSFSGFSQVPPPPFDQNINNVGEEKERDRRDRDRRRRRSRSNERHKNRSRSRSKSPTKSRRKSRSTSRNRNRKRGYKSRSRSRDRKEEREKEKERQRKGLPSIKREHLSVCTTTLWVGHLSKLVSQEEISDTFGSYGDIISIDVIPPRGCAFVVMNRRQDACRALDRLKNTKLQGKTITLAWAPGKGVKGRDWKDYWEVEAGVSYIPWSKLKLDTNLEEFEDGGCIDEDTLPELLKNRPKPPEPVQEKAPPLPSPREEITDNGISNESSVVATTPQTPALLPTPGMPTTGMSTPGMPTPGPGMPNPGMSARMSTPGISSLLGPPPLPDPIVSSAGDTDVRAEVAIVHNATSNSMGVGPTMNPGTFNMPPPVGMMGVPPMGMNMMVPPPLMGANMQGFQGMGNLPNLPNMQMMGMMGANMNVGNQGMVPPTMGAPGLLGDMPNSMPPSLAANIQQHMQMNNSLNIHSNEDSDRLNEEDRKRRADRRDNRIKKRSRFDDVEDRHSPPPPPVDIDNRNSPVHNDRSKDDRPLFERLKSLAEGYGFGGGNNEQSMNINNLTNSLLGAPIGPVGAGQRPPGQMERMPNPHGFPQPLLPMGPGHGPGAGPGNQFGPRLPFIGERPQGLPGPGPRPWFDNGNVQQQNPFLNPNPFAGNPFIQTNLNENPFDMGGPGPRNDNSGNNGPGPFFGHDRGNFGNRGGPQGGRGGHHHHPQGQDGGEFWGRGGGGGGGGGGQGGGSGARGRGGRGGAGGNWRGRWEEEEPWDREKEQNSGPPDTRDRDNRGGGGGGGFRGGRGGRGGRDNNWQPRDRDRNEREPRDRDRERDHGGRDRDRARDRDRDGERNRDRDDKSRDRDRDRDRSGRDRDRDRGRRDRRRSTEEFDKKDRDHRSNSSSANNNRHGDNNATEFNEENWDEEQSNTPQAPLLLPANSGGPPPQQTDDTLNYNTEVDQSGSQSPRQEEDPDIHCVSAEPETINENVGSAHVRNTYSKGPHNSSEHPEEFEEDNGQYDRNEDQGEETFDNTQDYTEEENFDGREDFTEEGDAENFASREPYAEEPENFDNSEDYAEEAENFDNRDGGYAEESENFDNSEEFRDEPKHFSNDEAYSSHPPHDDSQMNDSSVNIDYGVKSASGKFSEREYGNDIQDESIGGGNVHVDSIDNRESQNEPITHSVQLDKETNDNINANE